MPHRDLLVTPEHCIFVEGWLVPARMLVNQRSIIEDRTIGGYSFYHVELAQHAVLLAEGLATESYLDTGNRSSFANTSVIALHPALTIDAGHKSWKTDACAPLAVDRETVEPNWQALEQRALALGLGTGQPPITLSDDPELRLVLADGHVLEARWTSGGCHMFCLPVGAKPARLLSRTAVPAEVVGPFLDDRRRLGVAVEKVVLWSGLVDTVLKPTDLDLPGWHPAEGHFRWTDGDAGLDLPAAYAADTFLGIHIASTMQYARHDTSTPSAAAPLRSAAC